MSLCTNVPVLAHWARSQQDAHKGRPYYGRDVGFFAKFSCKTDKKFLEQAVCTSNVRFTYETIHSHHRPSIVGTPLVRVLAAHALTMADGEMLVHKLINILT